MTEKHLSRHVFCFNKNDNGGEAFTIVTDFYDNGDGVFRGLFATHEISLQSYCNCATIHLQGTELTPEKLRKLADELDEKIAEIKTKAMIDAKNQK